MYRVMTSASFDSAHFLKNYEGKCKNIHGHRWNVNVEVSNENLDEGSMVIDFTDIKKDLKKLCDNFDHSLIIEENSLKEKIYNALIEEGFKINVVSFRPTAECFAKYFYDELNKNYNITKVEVYETPNNKAVYER